MQKHLPLSSSSASSARPARQHQFDASLRAEASFSGLTAAAFRPPEVVVTDVSKDPAWQKRGVDYVYELPGPVLVDEKADSYTTGRCALEFATKTCWGALLPGWLTGSEMGWLHYGFTKTHEVLVVSMAELRERLLPRLREFQPASAVNKQRGGQGVRHVTFSALVPLSRLMELCPGAVWVSLAAELGTTPLIGRSLLPMGFASRKVLAGDALRLMGAGPGRCEPVAADLPSLWEHGCANDRMAWNAGALRSLNERDTAAA